MASPILTLLLIFLFLFCNPSKSESITAPTNFINASCSATTYPAVCIRSLSIYASTVKRSPRQLATIALSVSLETAQYTKTFLTKLTKTKGLKTGEYAALNDCLEEVSDGVDRLSKSVRELKTIGPGGGKDFIWHMSNVETWISAALTDDNTCMDGFSGRALNGRIKSSVRTQMTKLVQVTSNALALCNHFAA